MARHNQTLGRLMAGASVTLIGALIAGSALAQTKPAQITGAGAEGTEISDVIVTAESGAAALTAPAKASLEQTQPEAIISHKFIELATPETGGWTTVVSIAPSVSGTGSNGGGIGDYNVVTLRGFQDGQFNLTYDGIAFGDTNNPTHHGADYWPASTIGAAVVDRGPGAAGDLGQANYGGAIHYFSPEVSDKFGAVQKLTYGSFNTLASVTTINTGEVSWLGGGKLLLNFDERRSDGELSYAGGEAYNQLAKFILPIGDKGSLTLFGSHEYTRFNFEDSSGPGETWQQTQLYGKNFFMTANPSDEHYYGYNYEKKQTDFEYADVKYQVLPKLAIEDQAYTYYYSNKTISTNDLTGLVGGPNTSPPMASGANPSDIGGYNKLNAYRVYGDILRLNQDFSFGTLKIGGLVEGSHTDRHNGYIDLTQGSAPDDKFTSPKYFTTTNYKLMETSNWIQGQVFADFYWQVTDALKIAPGFKFVDFTRKVNAAEENVAGGAKIQPLNAKNNYTHPLYFLTANYKIQPYWSVYGQFATSFVIPPLSDLYGTGVEVQALKPNTNTNYQLGTVYTRGAITADADIYLINSSNLEVGCNIPAPIPTNPTATESGFCNVGSARYSGVEAEAAYAFNFGLTLFVNGSLNTAKQLAHGADVPAGIAASPAQELTNAPKWTDAVGALYTQGPWQGSVTYKQSGAYVAGYNGTQAIRLPGYGAINASAAYDFGHFAVKVQAFNLADKRAITSFTGAQLYSTTDTGIYTYQAGRELSITLIAKY